MFDDLEHYLSGIMAPERVELIIRLLQRCNDVVGEEATSIVAQYSLGVPQEVDTAEELSRWDDYLLDFLQSALADMGILLDDDVLDSSQIPVIDRLVFALQIVGGWEDNERLLAILTGADDLEMALAEVCAEINTNDSGEYALIIASVSRAFYNNLLDLVQSNAEAELAQQSVPDLSLMQRVKSYFQRYPSDRFVVGLIRSQNIVLGLDYPFYLKFYENTLYDQPPETLVHTLVDLAVCSSVSDKDVATTASNVVGQYGDGLEAGIRYKALLTEVVSQLPTTLGGNQEVTHVTA